MAVPISRKQTDQYWIVPRRQHQKYKFVLIVMHPLSATGRSPFHIPGLISRPHNRQPAPIIDQCQSIAKCTRTTGKIQNTAGHLLIRAKVPRRDEARVARLFVLGPPLANNPGRQLRRKHCQPLAPNPFLPEENTHTQDTWHSP